MADPASAAGTEQRRRQYPCPGCGATLEFAVGTRSLACPHCGRAEAIPETADAVQELDFDTYFRAPRKALASLGTKRVRCSGCGAATDSNELAQACPFCGAAIVVETSADELIAPEGVLPFGVPRGDAQTRFRTWIASRWFAPSDLVKLAANEGMRGVYVPFWTWDAYTRSFYTGERGDYYWVTETYTTVQNGQTVTQTRQVRHTAWTSVSGRVERGFDDVLVPAVNSIDRGDLDKLEPWDLPRLEAYAPDFLAGYDALRYEVDLPDGFVAAKAIMAAVIERDCIADIGGDEQRLSSVKTAYSAVTFKHVLMPIWVAAYRYRNRSWRVFVNARTGEVIGHRPVSWAKVIGLILLVLSLVAGGIIYARNAHHDDPAVPGTHRVVGSGGDLPPPSVPRHH